MKIILTTVFLASGLIFLFLAVSLFIDFMKAKSQTGKIYSHYLISAFSWIGISVVLLGGFVCICLGI